MSSGEEQGLMLDYLQFIIYINDLRRNVENMTGKLANDTEIVINKRLVICHRMMV